jgi:hypothetical protein
MLSESLALALHGSWPPCCDSATVTQFENSDVLFVAELVSEAVTTSPIASPPRLLLNDPLPPEAVTVAKSRYVSPSPKPAPSESHAAFLKNSTK